MLQNQTPKTNSTNTKNLLALQPVALKKGKKICHDENEQ